jgi:hypothetical protein
VGIDRPDDSDLRSDTHSDQPAEDGNAAGDGGTRPDRSRGVPVEVRHREEYDSHLRAAVAAEKRRDAGEQPAAKEAWDDAAERAGAEWADHQQRWPAEKRAAIDRSGDPPGSWRGESSRFLDSAANEYVDERCRRIAQTERDIVSPAMRSIERQDSGRRLIGYEHRLKGRDRVKDKVATDIEEKGRTAREAMSMIKDAIRYTFAYRAEGYADGVRADLARMEAKGFMQVERRNSWTDDQYKGINSRWREPATGQLFEVQFHTKASFEAKQLTHKAYERVRDPQTTRRELRELRSFQRGVCERIPLPPGAADIPDYP